MIDFATAKKHEKSPLANYNKTDTTTKTIFVSVSSCTWFLADRTAHAV